MKMFTLSGTTFVEVMLNYPISIQWVQGGTECLAGAWIL